MRPPLKYPPSLLNDSPQARTRFRRDYRVFLREAVQYLGAEAVEQDLHDIISRQGRAPNEELNTLLLDEWDAAVAENPTVTRTEFAKGFCERYRQQSVRAVEKRLTRLLQARERKAERERKLLARLKRPTLLGTE
jgi:hypothetical protein